VKGLARVVDHEEPKKEGMKGVMIMKSKPPMNKTKWHMVQTYK
jgi:hypothetical protein